MASPAIAYPALLDDTWKNLYYPPEEKQYTYFRHAERFPFTALDYSKEQQRIIKAAWAADASMLAYNRYGSTLMPEGTVGKILAKAGFTQVELIGEWKEGAQGTQGFFASNKLFAILAFRGTGRDNPKDMLTDADVLSVGEPEGLLNACRAHRGFQRGLNEVWNGLKTTLETFRDYHPAAEICFTGHSLGAAMATIAVSRFTRGKASLYTIGSPRVGNAIFCERVHQNADSGVFRFVNHNDLVTHIPIQDFFYRHVEEECLHFDHEGKLSQAQCSKLDDLSDLTGAIEEFGARWRFFDLDAKAPARLVDHSPARYCMRLQNLLADIKPLASKAAEEL